MSTTDPIAALAAHTQAGNTARKNSATDLGIDDFLALMTAQLKNQDPMKPLDSTEFVAQLAQFGTVSGVQEMQNSLGALTESLRSAQALQGTSLVGHDVLAAADTTVVASGESVRGALEIPTGTSSIKLTVSDISGQVVRHITVPANGSANGNLQEFVWDGLDDQGEPVVAGTYEFTAVANIGGTNESLQPYLASRVSSVSIDAAGTGLTLNTNSLGALALSDVRRVM